MAQSYDPAVIVAIDVGNTNLRLGVIREEDVTSAREAPTRADELDATLDGLLQVDGASLDNVETVVLASVVPAVSAAVARLVADRGLELIVADAMTVPIRTRVDFPNGVGDDRLANAFAASRLYGAPAVVVDLGTATTFDVVAADGAFVGGAIAAGAGLGLHALATRTAQLPKVDLVMPPHAIGTNTVEAMQSGAVIGHVGLIGELIRAITAELALDGDARPKVILTGGLSTADWAAAIPGVDVIDPLLTLRGLALLHAHVEREEVVSA